MAGKDKVAEVAENTDDKPVEAVETVNAVVEEATDVAAENNGSELLEPAPVVVAEGQETAAVAAAASDDMVSKADIEKIVNAYLDANLADLVAAAMPVQADPDVAEQERLEAAEREIEAKRESEAKKAAAKAEKERKALVEARQEAIERAQKLFEHGEVMPAFADLDEALTGVTHGRLVASNGDTYSPDVAETFGLDAIEYVVGRGIILKQPLVFGVGLDDEFTIHSFDLFLVSEDGPPSNAPLKCDLVSPVTVGGGKNASFAAGSLLFRIEPAAAQ